MNEIISNNDKYYDCLLQQFLSAKGCQMKDFSSHLFVNEFSEWLEKMDNLGKQYLTYLYQIASKNVIDSEKTFEIGKGFKDTIVGDLSTSMITPYGDSILPTIKKNIIVGEFFVSRGLPCIHKVTLNGEYDEKIRRGQYTFMIQNPYHADDLLNWDFLRNGSEHNILVGVYGCIKDKDYNGKIKMLKKLREQLVGQVKMERLEEDGNYFYMLNGEKQEKFIKEIHFRM